MEHSQQSELTSKLTRAAEKVTVGAQYIHYKQLTYKVLTLALREEDCEPCVVYQAEYGEKLVWTRLLSSWLSTVEVDGKNVPRFQKLEE